MFISQEKAIISLQRVSLILAFNFALIVATRGQDAELDKSLTEINDRFQNIDVKLIEWPDEVHKQLGELKKIGFMAYPSKRVEGKLPLLITLHGGGEITNSTQKQLVRSSQLKGLALAEAAGKNLILLEPHSSGDFDPKPLNIMLDYILKTHEEIDANRVYVMGHSMGGSGTWKWINESPERFAAAAPCGFSATEGGDASRLVKLPIWGMVGGKDGKNTTGIKAMVERLKAVGNPNVQYTEFPGATHGPANAAVFHSVDLVEWMLGFSLAK